MRECILIVDDQDDIREYLYYALNALQKYDLLTAENGIQGLKILENEHIDLILTDQQMPGMSGLEMLTALEEQGRQIPSILSTGQGSEETAVAAFRLGVLDYLIKPVRVDEIEASVEKALRTSRLERERVELIEELTRNNSDLKQRAREFNVLYGVGQTINADHICQTVYHRIVDGAVFAVGAEAGGLVLWNAEEEKFYIHAIKNKGGEAYTVHQPVNNSMIARAFRTKRFVLASPKATSAHSGNPASDNQSTLYMPILSRRRAIGVLYVTTYNPYAPLTRADTQVLAALADYVALATYHNRVNGVLNQQALEDEISNITI